MALDTSTAVMSAAVLGIPKSAPSSEGAGGATSTEGAQVCAAALCDTAQRHAGQVMPMLDSVLKRSDIEVSRLDEIWVCNGPGSFTGVRIGVATVKGLAMPLNIPVRTFSSTRLMACSAYRAATDVVPVSKPWVAVLDAKRGDVYYGVYGFEKGVVTVYEEGVEVLEALLNRSALRGAQWVCSEPPILQRLEHLERGEQKRACVLCVPEVRYLTLPQGEGEAPILTAQAIGANYMRASQAERDRRK